MTLTITFTSGRSERITYDHRYQHQGDDSRRPVDVYREDGA